jgi:flagellar motor component MotA
MLLRVVVSFFLISGVLAGAMAMHGSVLNFIDPASLLLVLGILAGGTIWSFSLDQITGAFSSYFGGKELSEQAARELNAVFNRMADISVGAGFAGTIIGLVLMLSNMSDPTAIGPAMAIALLTLFYGVILGELFFRSAAQDALSRASVFGDVRERRGSTNLYGVIAGLMVTMVCFFVMLLSMASFSF